MLHLSPTTPSNSAAQTNYYVQVGRNKTRVRLAQFSLLQAHAITGHKSQGQTISRIVVQGMLAKKKSDCSKKGTSCLIQNLGWFYTAISRTTSSEGLYIIGKIPYDKLQRREDIEAEMTRLRELHDTTKARLYTACSPTRFNKKKDARMRQARRNLTKPPRANRNDKRKFHQQ